jgi:outer membrane receptor protein involved in Fe transport
MKTLLVATIFCTTIIATQAQTSPIDSAKINIDNFYGDYAQHSFKMNQPLFILEGTVFSVDSLNKINPETIESLQILKGQDAEPYGEKGKNGVIIIKLKTIRKSDD